MLPEVVFVMLPVFIAMGLLLGFQRYARSRQPVPLALRALTVLGAAGLALAQVGKLVFGAGSLAEAGAFFSGFLAGLGATVVTLSSVWVPQTKEK